MCLGELGIIAQKHDLIALHIYDPIEMRLPDLGMIQLYDRESGLSSFVDTSNGEIRKRYSQEFIRRIEAEERTIRKWGCDYLALDSCEDYMRKLSLLLAGRGR